MKAAVFYGQDDIRIEEVPDPVLFLESDMADPRTWSDSRIKGSITAFLDIVDESKKRT